MPPARSKAPHFFATLNKLWDGDPVSQVRVSTDSRHARDVRLSLNLMIQPEVLRPLLERQKGVARNIGLLSRVMFAEPPSTKGSRPYRQVGATPGINKFVQRTYQLATAPLPHPSLPNGMPDVTRVQPPVLTLDPAAHAAWVAYHDRIEGLLTSTYADAHDVASKSAENAARLAAVFHVFENMPVPGGAATLPPIDQATMARAIEVAEWCLDETQRCLGRFGCSGAELNAVKLWAWLKARGAPSVPLNEVLQLGPAAMRKKQARDAAVAVLENHGLCRRAKAPDGTVHLVLNPKG